MGKILRVIFLASLIFIISSLSIYAAVTVDYSATAPSSTKVADANCAGYTNFTCNNGPTIGNPAGCGNICDGGNVWTRYSYSACYEDPLFLGSYRAWAPPGGNSCSTADKYNDRYNEGDTTMLRAGGCLCETKSLYKTCCNGTNAVGTYQAGGNPIFPDGGCSFTTKACGSDPAIYAAMGQPFTNVACGAAACALPPTPTPTPACPTELWPPPENQPAFYNRSCSPVGQTCSVNCSKTCTVGSQSCPATSCTTVWGCQGGRWFNDGTYYSTCPATCSATPPECFPGQTRIDCQPSNVCRL